MPKVSIIMPSFNVAPYIRECMDSVLAQTLTDIEVIVADADSTDGTREILEEYARNDTRITILTDDKKSSGYANNKAIDYATGEYIGIVETDDYIVPDMYEKQYKTAKKYQLDMLRADSKHFIETKEGEVAFFVALSKKQELYDCILDLTKDNRILQLGVNSFWSGLYRRQFLLEQKLFMNETRGAAYQDTTFSFLSSVKAKRVMLSQEAFY